MSFSVSLEHNEIFLNNFTIPKNYYVYIDFSSIVFIFIFFFIKLFISLTLINRKVIYDRDLLVKQMGWMARSGEDINVWDDPWLSHCEQLRTFGLAPEALQSLKVSDLFLPESSEWNLKKIELTLPFHKEQILRLRPSKLKIIDELVWLKAPYGEYSTRSCYLTLTEENSIAALPTQSIAPDWLSNVWNIKTSEKIKVFIWKFLHDVLYQ